MENKLIRIDDEVFSAEDFVKHLKFSGSFEGLIQDFIAWKVTVHAARQRGLAASEDEVREEGELFRRSVGVYRESDSIEWLNMSGLTVAEFDDFIAEILLKKRLEQELAAPAAIEEYYQLHSPSFESVDIRQIVVASESAAREIAALAADEAESFESLARQHSLDEATRGNGGWLAGLARDMFPPEIGAKIFNANPGDVLGPFQLADGARYQVATVVAKHPAQLDETTRAKIAGLIHGQWLRERLQEHMVSR